MKIVAVLLASSASSNIFSNDVVDLIDQFEQVDYVQLYSDTIVEGHLIRIVSTNETTSNSTSVNNNGSNDEDTDNATTDIINDEYSNYGNNNTFTPDQYTLCLQDLVSSDSNSDSMLSPSEYLTFLSLNSASNGFGQFLTGDNYTLSDLPPNYSMAFHSTACECAFRGEGAECCVGEREHVNLYYADNLDEDGNDAVAIDLDSNSTTVIDNENNNATSVVESNSSDVSSSILSPEQESYTRNFCEEVYYAYSVTNSPTPEATTDSPTARTMTPSVAPSEGGSTAMPSPGGTDAVTFLPTSTEISSPSPAPVSSNVPASTEAPVGLNSSTPTISGVEITTPPATSLPAPTVSVPVLVPTSLPVGIATNEPSLGGTNSSNILPVYLQFGISSNCGVTSFDVLNKNGNTIADGLTNATAVIVEDILNSTFPRGEVRGMQPRGVDYIGSNYTDKFDETMETSPDEGGALERERKKKKKKKRNEEQRSVNTRVLHPEEPTATLYDRKLVYYSADNPIVITDVKDVLDQACPAGVNCMSVYSTVQVVLEDGDDPDAITSAITDGVQETFNDGTFFQAIPPETIFCPSDIDPPSTVTSSTTPTLPPIAVPVSGMPSPSSTNSSSSVITTSPASPMMVDASTTSPSSINLTFTPTGINLTTIFSPSPLAPSSFDNNSSISSPPPVTSSMPPISAPVGLSSPTPSNSSAASVTPTLVLTGGTSPPVNGSESNVTSDGNLTIQITYDIANDCGLDAEAVMNQVNNTLKTGLIEATTITAVEILNQTYPRENNLPSVIRGNTVRSHKLFSSDIHLKNSKYSNRKLVYYTDEFPVTIDRIIDITEDCEEGSNCLLILSTITTVSEPGDDPEAINQVIEDGMSNSFEDGSFFENIPADTVICPERRNRWLTSNGNRWYGY